MKEKIFAGLKTKFDGVQDAILNRVAEKLSETVTTEDAVATAVEGVTLQGLLDSYADSRANEASQTAVRNFRQKHGLGEDGKPIKKEDPKPQPKPEPTGGDEPPQWFRDYQAKVEADLTEAKTKLQEYENSKTQEKLMGLVKAKLKEKGVDEDFIPLLTKNIAIGSEDQIDQLVTGMHEDYQSIVQTKAEKGVVISVPPSSVQVDKQGEALGKMIAEKKNTGKQAGVQGKQV